MKITSDWHIHSRNSCDQACMAVADLVREAAAKGIEDFGLTDHIHTPYNLPDLERSREEYDGVDPSPRFHFGVEASVVSKWELDQVAAGAVAKPVYGVRQGGPAGAELALGLTQDDIVRLGIEYVVGGTHWPMYVPYERDAIIREFHRQNLFLAQHELVDIVAHPWWWHGHWRGNDGMFEAEPWFDDFGHIPTSMHDELAATVVEHGKAIEINPGAILLNPGYPERFKEQYLEYLAGLKARGVRLSIGSDCHSQHYSIDFPTVETLLDRTGIRTEDLWTLPPR